MRISYWSSTCALPICDRVLASEAADAGDLGHAGRGGELVAQVPVLHGAQLVQRVAVALQDVLVDPAHARGIGSERRGNASRQILRRRSEEHTSELQSLMRISYAVFCLKTKSIRDTTDNNHNIYRIILTDIR